MKLFHLKRPNYDEAYAGWYEFCVIAPNEAIARTMHPLNMKVAHPIQPGLIAWREDRWQCFRDGAWHPYWDIYWIEPKNVIVTEICDVSPSATPGPLPAVWDEG